MADAQKAQIKEVIDKLANVTGSLEEKTVKQNNNKTFTIESLKDVLETLKSALCKLAGIVEKDSDTVTEMEANQKVKNEDIHEKLRHQDDEIDIQQQKHLLGKIVISSTKKGEPSSFIKSKETLKSEGVSLKTHVVWLTDTKYGLEIEESDIESCFHLPNGGIMVSFWKKSLGSPFQKLACKIKSSENSEKNLYFNFCLTKRRSKLLFAVRKLKRDNQIQKFYSDEHGMISIKKLDSNSKQRLTNIPRADSSFMKTWTVEELHHEIPPIQQ